jgi:putative ABC transport system substrate-binding protein
MRITASLQYSNTPTAGQQLKSIWLGLSIVAVVLLVAGAVAEAQPANLRQIGFLRRAFPQAPDFEAFRQALRELGYIDGKNVAIEQRYANGVTDRLPDLVAELVGLKVEVIVVDGTITANAAKAATKTIPIVFTLVSDPVGSGIVASLARPGGNITGVTHISSELSPKRLELLKEAIPRTSRVAVLVNRDNVAPSRWEEFQSSARVLTIQLQIFDVRHPKDLESALSLIATGNADGLIAWPDAIFDSKRKQVVELNGKRRLPGIYERREYVEVGGLMSYGVNVGDNFRRAATYVDKILKGSRPANLPVEQPTKFELVINLKAAKQIGLTIPPNVLARADRVIK